MKAKLSKYFVLLSHILCWWSACMLRDQCAFTFKLQNTCKVCLNGVILIQCYTDPFRLRFLFSLKDKILHK